MATTTTNFGWTVPSDTDLVKDGASAIRTALGGVDTSFVDLKGGTSGQMLTKASGTDLDFTWVTPQVGDITSITATSPLTGGGTTGDVTVGIQAASTSQSGAVQLTDSTSSTSTTTAATPNSVKTSYDLANAAIPKSTVTTSGDIIYATGSSAVTRLGVGTTGQILTVSGGVPTWATPAAASSGLTLIHSSTFSAVSSKSITGCFTSTYRNYKVIFIITAGTQSASTKLRFSVSGTDDTNSLYSTAFPGSRTNGTFAPITSNAQNAADIGRIENNSTQVQTQAFDIMNPQVANRTGFGVAGMIMDSTGYAGIAGGGAFDANTQFDGITFYPTAGTMTGYVAVYGYSL